MNLLAHAFLSFKQPPILIGNIISDYVKGKNKFNYPLEIQKGIMLHRAIDSFTDLHPATKTGKQFFKPVYGLYAGAFMDVVYDHFLANDTAQFIDEKALQDFALFTYYILENNTQYLPEKVMLMLPFMKAQNWLYHYQFNYGIEKSFGGLVKRATYLSDPAPAYKIFENNYAALQQYYLDFFPSVKKLAANWLQQD